MQIAKPLEYLTLVGLKIAAILWLSKMHLNTLNATYAWVPFTTPLFLAQFQHSNVMTFPQ